MVPITGVSRIYNHAFKLKTRKDGVNIETVAIPCAGSHNIIFKAMMDMVHREELDIISIAICIWL